MSDNQFDLLTVRNETFVQELVFHDEIDSTNTEILRLASQQQATPLLVLAEKQTAGRGRGAHHWWAGEGALTFSLLLDFPMLEPAQLNSFSLTVGLAVCQTIEHVAPAADVALKWPNDVYFNGKKIAGILIERPDATEPRLAVGIGINVNNSFATAPEELRGHATSLIDELESAQELTPLLVECLHHLERRSKEQIHQVEDLLDQWRAYCLLTGCEIEVESAGRRIAGLCRGIDSTGALLVERDGVVEKVVAGSVVRFG